jgi:hypothetical protein
MNYDNCWTDEANARMQIQRYGEGEYKGVSFSEVEEAGKYTGKFLAFSGDKALNAKNPLKFDDVFKLAEPYFKN